MSKTQLSLNGDGDQPVTQAEFSTTMTALKADLDQLATKADLEQLSSETKAGFEQVRDEMATKADLEKMATKAELAKLQKMTERILELIEGMDQKFKPLQNLPERMERVERALFP